MNALSPQPDTALLDLVSFKWLMAGKGWWVDLPRMQKDEHYARACVQRGLESGHPLLGERSAEVLAVLACAGAACEAAFALSNSVRI